LRPAHYGTSGAHSQLRGDASSCIEEARERLKVLGRKGETYDDVIMRLIEFYGGAGAKINNPFKKTSKMIEEGVKWARRRL